MITIFPQFLSAQDEVTSNSFSDMSIVNKKISSNISIADLVEKVSPSVVNITVSYGSNSPQLLDMVRVLLFQLEKRLLPIFTLLITLIKLKLSLMMEKYTQLQ